MVVDKNMIRSSWKLAQVCEVFESRDKVVRDVSIRYKNQGPDAEYRGTQDTVVRRSAHRLILILPVEEQSTT